MWFIAYGKHIENLTCHWLVACSMQNKPTNSWQCKILEKSSLKTHICHHFSPNQLSQSFPHTPSNQHQGKSTSPVCLSTSQLPIISSLKLNKLSIYSLSASWFRICTHLLGITGQLIIPFSWTKPKFTSLNNWLKRSFLPSWILKRISKKIKPENPILSSEIFYKVHLRPNNNSSMK